jgi:type 1 fimbriae regulatory protein FimB/type 1 fimbriae regulatory protein FimE
MSKSALRVVRTDAEPNTEMQSSAERRAYLTEAEVEQLLKAADGHRDEAMILVAYRHGLRVSELVALTWAQVDLNAGRLQVRRLKGSEDGVHPLSGREVRLLRRLRREQPVGSRFLFTTRLGGPFTRDGFAKLLAACAVRAGLDGVHPHLLRHGTGFKLVNGGMDSLSLAAYLGHRNVNNTARYTKMDAHRFDGLWRD